MKEFLSPFQEELTDFLAMRKKTVGAETYAGDCRILGSFDRFFTAYGCTEKSVSEDVVNAWIQSLFASNARKHYLDWRGISRDLNRHTFSSQTHEHMTVSCIEEIYKKYVAEAREQHPEMFLQSKYTPHTMRHTTATHMLEAGVPLMAIKNFLGHASVATTERYAELSQTTTDKHIREWNRRWFWDADPADDPKRQTSPTDFLK